MRPRLPTLPMHVIELLALLGRKVVELSKDTVRSTWCQLLDKGTIAPAEMRMPLIRKVIVDTSATVPPLS